MPLSENQPDLPEGVSAPSERGWRADMNRIDVEPPLTEDECRYLAMHARYEANRQLDARGYVIGVHEDGALKLSERWNTRQERHDRWNAIADALHPDTRVAGARPAREAEDG